MKRYYHRKLVRDKIPEIIIARGGKFEAKVVSRKILLSLLKKKLIEESKEIVTAKKGEILDELADVFQILKSVGELENYKLSDIERRRREKEKTNGAYKKGLFLLWSDKPKGFGDKTKKHAGGNS